MIEVLWASLALCALALTAALISLLLAARDLLKKSELSLDSFNRELPAMLSAARQAAEDAEALLSVGKSLGKAATWAGGLLKGAQFAASLFGKGKPHCGEKTHTQE